MRYVFDILTQVQFKHSYFSDNVFSGLDVNMDSATKKTFDNLGLLYKAFSGGFYILYDKNLANKTRERAEVLNEHLILEFTLELKDPLFYNYTANLPKQIDKSIYQFHNSLTPVSGEPNPLHSGPFAGEKDVVKLLDDRNHFFKKPFAKLSLMLHPEMEASYYIAFNVRQTYWRYIFMSDYLQNLTSPAIIDDNDTNIFGDQFDIDLPDAKKVRGFVSADKLNLGQRQPKRFRLVENFATGSSTHRDVIKALPYPDVNYISRIPIRGTDPVNYSDIFIH